MNILTVNLLMSTLVFWVAAKLYLLPKMDGMRSPGLSCCRSCCCIRSVTLA